MTNSFLDQALLVVRDVIEWIYDGINSIWKWFRDLFTTNESDNVSHEPAKNKFSLRQFLYGLLIVLGICLLGFLFRVLKRRKAAEETNVLAMCSRPDLTDDAVKADELPTDEWLLLAEEWVRKGDSRLALRAVYFATLSCLADNRMVRIARHKSNRDYALEFIRRGREIGPLPDTFQAQTRQMDRAWYGGYMVDQKDVENFLRTHGLIKHGLIKNGLLPARQQEHPV